MNLATLDDHDWVQIQQAVSGCISGTLSEWPHLQGVFSKLGMVLPDATPYRELQWVCRSLYWEHKADQHGALYGQAIAEIEALSEKIRNLETAVKLEHEFGAAPE